jgi:hypothetical protein
MVFWWQQHAILVRRLSVELLTLLGVSSLLFNLLLLLGHFHVVALENTQFFLALKFLYEHGLFF